MILSIVQNITQRRLDVKILKVLSIIETRSGSKTTQMP